MNRHRSDVISLIAGLLFVGLAAAWALDLVDVLPRSSAGWLLPAVLIAVGAAGLISARPRRHGADDDGLDGDDRYLGQHGYEDTAGTAATLTDLPAEAPTDDLPGRR